MSSLPLSPLTAIAPSDGRYANKTESLRRWFSEYGLIAQRIEIEIAWFKYLVNTETLPEILQSPTDIIQFLDELQENFDEQEALRVKEIEQVTKHDVKAVEYYLRKCFKKNKKHAHLERFIHFACTSEDINNLAWARIIRQAREQVLLPAYGKIHDKLLTMARQYASLPMLAYTHGQPASPTTLGKELINVVARLDRQLQILKRLPVTGKFNGAVGNYNAHHIAYPEADWQKISIAFIKSLGLEPITYTTQIEPHDTLAEILNSIARNNQILLDLCRDIWGYIALRLFTQKIQTEETGSSTMPHKVNPIDFENAEGNIGIANAIAAHLAEKLPISRWQRDLSDSTALRTLGLVFAHTLIALESLNKGLEKIKPNTKRLQEELDQHWEVLTEAIQTVMRRYNIDNGYERLKELTRGKSITKNDLHVLLETLDLPSEVRKGLKKLTPADYIGLAEEMTKAYR